MIIIVCYFSRFSWVVAASHWETEEVKERIPECCSLLMMMLMMILLLMTKWVLLLLSKQEHITLHQKKHKFFFSFYNIFESFIDESKVMCSSQFLLECWLKKSVKKKQKMTLKATAFFYLVKNLSFVQHFQNFTIVRIKKKGGIFCGGIRPEIHF